jgi:hypothetical protein
MKMALEALEMLAKWEHPASHITTKSGRIYPHHVAANAATALRTAIEQAEKQEPVAWMYEWDGKKHLTFTDQRFVEQAHPHFNKSTPLYTTPPAAQRQWVKLTDAEINDCMEMSIQKTCRAIEAKLREKNGGQA